MTGSCDPCASIYHNDYLLWHGIVDDIKLEFNIDLTGNDVIAISGIGKRHGEQGIYDTVIDDRGHIVSDKFLTIKDIIIDDISMGPLWIRSINIIENFTSDSIFQNGKIEIRLTLPVIDWIIQEKIINIDQKNQSQPDSSYSGNDRFAYEYINTKIGEIKKILGK